MVPEVIFWIDVRTFDWARLNESSAGNGEEQFRRVPQQQLFVCFPEEGVLTGIALRELVPQLLWVGNDIWSLSIGKIDLIDLSQIDGLMYVLDRIDVSFFCDVGLTTGIVNGNRRGICGFLKDRLNVVFLLYCAIEIELFCMPVVA